MIPGSLREPSDYARQYYALRGGTQVEGKAGKALQVELEAVLAPKRNACAGFGKVVRAEAQRLG
jgi:hypothetical protein